MTVPTKSAALPSGAAQLAGVNLTAALPSYGQSPSLALPSYTDSLLDRGQGFGSRAGRQRSGGSAVVVDAQPQRQQKLNLPTWNGLSVNGAGRPQVALPAKPMQFPGAVPNLMPNMAPKSCMPGQRL